MIKALGLLRRGRLAVAGALAMILMAGLATPALAAPKRKVGLSLNGTPAGPVRKVISSILKHHKFVTVSPDQAPESDADIAALARELKLTALVLGDVRNGGKRLKLRVYNGSGELIGEGSWAAAGGPKKLAASVKHTFWTRVGGALGKARPATAAEGRPRREQEAPKEEAPKEEATKAPSAPSASNEEPAAKEAEPAEEPAHPVNKKAKRAPAAAKEEGDEESDDSGGASAGGAATALDLAVGPRFITRNLGWTNNSAGALRTYKLGLAPSVGLTLAWYPGAHVRSDWVANVGLAASAEYTPGLVSTASDGVRYPSQESDYWGGLRGRLPLGAVEPALTVGYGQHSFVFKSDGAANRANLADLPDVSYTYVRAAADVRVRLPANLALMLGGGYRVVLNAGDKNFLVGASSYFPNIKVAAFDATAAVGYRFWSILEARVGFDLRRYALTTNVKAGDTYVITGGTDQYIALWAQLAVMLGGTDHAARATPAAADQAPPARPKPRRAEPAADEDAE